jgi:hypothetical protein
MSSFSATGVKIALCDAVTDCCRLSETSVGSVDDDMNADEVEYDDEDASDSEVRVHRSPCMLNVFSTMSFLTMCA